MRCAEARRVALIRLGDEGLMEQAALSDPAPLVRRRMVRELHHIDILSQKIRPVLERKLLDERHRMQLMAQRMDTVNPERMLRRGYSITLHYGKSVRDPKLLKQGDKIETIVEKGSVISIIK